MLDNTGTNTSPQSISCHWLAWMRMPWMPTWMSYWTCALGSSAAKLSTCQTPAAPKSRTWRNCSIFVLGNSCLRVCPEFSFQLCWLLDLEISWGDFKSGHWCHTWSFVFVGSTCSFISGVFSPTLRAEISCILFPSVAGSPTWASSVSSKAEKDSDIEDPMAEALELCSGSFPTDRSALLSSNLQKLILVTVLFHS